MRHVVQVHNRNRVEFKILILTHYSLVASLKDFASQFDIKMIDFRLRCYSALRQQNRIFDNCIKVVRMA